MMNNNGINTERGHYVGQHRTGWWWWEACNSDSCDSQNPFYEASPPAPPPPPAGGGASCWTVSEREVFMQRWFLSLCPIITRKKHTHTQQYWTLRWYCINHWRIREQQRWWIRTLVIYYQKVLLRQTGRRWGWRIKNFFSHNAIGVACVRACACVCECVWGTDSLWWSPPLQDTVKLVFLKYYFNQNMYKRLFRRKTKASINHVCFSVDLWPYQVAQ